MAILVDAHTRLVVQGITGRAARVHLDLMRAQGTLLVGGVTPGRGGSEIDGIPVFDTVDGETGKRVIALDDLDRRLSAVEVGPAVLD